MKIDMIAALILDFDGLILDTETPALESWRSIYAEYGCELSLELWREVLGTSRSFDALENLAKLLRDTQPNVVFDRADLRTRRDYMKVRMTSEQPLLPGVRALLDQADARGLPCAVASSSKRQWVESWLRHHGIFERFICIRTADDVAQTKPAPDLFLSAAACLGLSPAQCLAFEDSANGILAAQAAGMPCIAVPGAISRQFAMPAAELVLTALDELSLAEMLTRLGGQ
jgi:HAD superfamily hydrolase (TIGR01509 family)